MESKIKKCLANVEFPNEKQEKPGCTAGQSDFINTANFFEITFVQFFLMDRIFERIGNCKDQSKICKACNEIFGEKDSE